MQLSLRVRDTAMIAANFYAADRVIQTGARALNRERGLFTRDLTRFFCPVDTRFMQDHVRVIFSDDGKSFQVGWLADDFTGAGLPFYPPFQEFGTYKMRAQPSLGPAYEEARRTYAADVKRFYRDALHRALTRRGGSARGRR